MRSTTVLKQQQDNRLRIRLFGVTEVTRGEEPIEHTSLGGVKPRQVLEILAVAAGTPVAKDQLAEMLWEGRPPRSYAGTLESYVCLLRRALGLSGRGSALATVMHGYLLDPERVVVDLVEFRRLARPGRSVSGESADLSRLQEAVQAASLATSGPLLASETYAAWAEQERTDVARELACVAAEGAACALRVGRSEDAVRLARVAVAQDAYDEDAWRILIAALCAAGRRPEALRAYAELSEVLARELATTPSDATTRCYLAALAGGRAQAPGSAHELRVLLDLVRESVRALPGVDALAADRGLVQLMDALPVAG